MNSHFAYPPVEVSNDGEGNINNLIRVDHGHSSAPLAEEDYRTVTAENMQVVLGGEDHIVFMADARCTGLALRLGLYH
eukprot:5488141-Heterocapsa_arctica.AAC.1